MNRDSAFQSKVAGIHEGARCDLGDLFTPEFVVLQLEATSKEEILAEMVGLLVADQPREVQEAALEALIQREEVGSTGIGDGVAIPHARVPVIQQIRVAAGVSQEGLDFQSLDGKPVHLIFLILTPAGASGGHLRFLAQLTRLLRSAQLREDLRSVGTAQEFCHILRLASKRATERRS